MIIHSTFAILDVKNGREKLRKRIEEMAKLGNDVRIPVVIRGYIDAIHSRDDGVSREFSVVVETAEELDG